MKDLKEELFLFDLTETDYDEEKSTYEPIRTEILNTVCPNEVFENNCKESARRVWKVPIE